MDRSSIIWSEKAYKLQDFDKKFKLPQLVCVEDGYYDEKDETTLSRDDVLTLHLLQKTRFYEAVDRNGQEIYIPVNLEATVETVSYESIRTYQSIQELIEVSAKRVKSVHSHPWLLIDAGDTLQVREVSKAKGVERLRLSFISKPQKDVNIPITYIAVFQVVPDITRLWLMEVENTFTLPIRIRFTDKTLQVKPDDELNSEDVSTIADLGEVTLQRIHEIDKFIASTKNENRIMVLKIPANTDITVKAGIGIEQKDYTYVEVCRYYHQRARLENLDDVEEECIKIGETDVKVERIYDFVEEYSDEDDEHDYEEMPPEVPSRINRASLHQEKEPSHSGSSDVHSEYDSADYELVVQTPEALPPIPNRIQSLQNNSRSSEQSLCTRIINALTCARTESANQSNSTKNNREKYEKADKQGRYVGNSTIRSNTASVDRPVRDVQEPVNLESEFSFPERLEALTVEGVCRCLKLLNMEHHVERFRHNQINGRLFITLTEDLLISLGVINKFQQTKLLKFIDGWRPE